MDWRGWSRRQIAAGSLLLAAFVAIALVLPVLITADRQETAPEPTPTQTKTQARTPTPTTTPTQTRPTTQPSFLLKTPVRPRPVHDPPRRIYREFQSVCTLRRQTTRPPVSGQPRATYQVFGSTETELAAPGRLPRGSTSCINADDRSTYWIPALYQGGELREPDDFTVLYKGTVEDYTSVQAFPPGLRIMVSGDEEEQLSWSCTGHNEPTLPDGCPPGDRLTLRLSSPPCWDGRHLDVSGHRSHLAWPVGGRCPADHPVAIPTLLVDVIYPLEGDGALKISGGEAGFGFVSGWRPKTLAHLVKTCINAGEQCNAQGEPG